MPSPDSFALARWIRTLNLFLQALLFLSFFGGLTFGGGPIGNYMSHAVASMVGKLRETGGKGLLFANGGYATHVLVPHPKYLFDIGDLPPERAAPLGEPRDEAQHVLGDSRTACYLRHAQ